MRESLQNTKDWLSSDVPDHAPLNDGMRDEALIPRHAGDRALVIFSTRKEIALQRIISNEVADEEGEEKRHPTLPAISCPVEIKATPAASTAGAAASVGLWGVTDAFTRAPRTGRAELEFWKLCCDILDISETFLWLRFKFIYQYFEG